MKLSRNVPGQLFVLSMIKLWLSEGRLHQTIKYSKDLYFFQGINNAVVSFFLVQFSGYKLLAYYLFI